MTLFASFENINEVLFYDALQDVAKKNAHISVVYTITQEHKGFWQGEKGRITKALLEKYIKDILAPAYYLVGSAAMVAGIKDVLLAMGIDEAKIRTEDFTGY